MVHDASMSDIVLEYRDVTLQGWGELPVFLSHMLDRKPGDNIPSSVLVFESCLKLSKEII